MGKHGTENLLITCIDYRLPEDREAQMKLLGVKDFDHCGYAGGAKNLTPQAKPHRQLTALEDIEIGIRLHGVKRVILANHLDSGAYGGSEKFKTREEEIGFHQSELRAAAKLLTEKFPKLEIKMLILNPAK